jgi:hypothetical protein
MQGMTVFFLEAGISSLFIPPCYWARSIELCVGVLRVKFIRQRTGLLGIEDFLLSKGPFQRYYLHALRFLDPELRTNPDSGARKTSFKGVSIRRQRDFEMQFPTECYFWA